jgi:hypothetical protein
MSRVQIPFPALISGARVALVAQLAEHILGKDEVTGSIPVKGFGEVVRNKKEKPS